MAFRSWAYRGLQGTVRGLPHPATAQGHSGHGPPLVFGDHFYFPAVVACAGAAAVDLRTTSSGSTAISPFVSAVPSICDSNVSAAIRPIFLSGWRTVVRLGIQKDAWAMSSKPT